MDALQQGQSGQQQQQQPTGRAEKDAAEEESAGQPPPAVATAAAAAEDPTPAIAAAGQYDPREFQNPHPDDATTATGAATTAGRSKTAKTKVGKAAKKGGGKGDADGEPCSNCGTLGASRKCSQCRQTQYCGEECFKVRERARTGGRARAVHSAHLIIIPPLSESTTPTTPTQPGTLEVRRAQEGLCGVCPGGRRPGAAGPAVQEGGRGGAVPDLPRAAARAHDAAVRSRVLHGVRGGAAVEGRVGDMPAMSIAASAGPGEAVGAGVPGVGEDRAGGGLEFRVASAVGVTAGRDGRCDRDAAGGDGPGERGGRYVHSPSLWR